MAAMLSVSSLSSISSFSGRPSFNIHQKVPNFSSSVPLLQPLRASDNGSGIVGASTVEAKVAGSESSPPLSKLEGSLGSVNGAPTFEDLRWVNGTWDLQQFKKGGETDWDTVIDAGKEKDDCRKMLFSESEVKRRKWFEDNPESSSNDRPVVFDTSIIPWWAWVKRFHLPEAELLNGRAAMIGFFMAYFVDSLTGVGLVDQTGNFFCKLLLFVAVVGVLFVRKNEDIETIKTLINESTFYDKQWQAAWQDDTSNVDNPDAKN